jgi:hypothetical protein
MVQVEGRFVAAGQLCVEWGVKERFAKGALKLLNGVAFEISIRYPCFGA